MADQVKFIHDALGTSTISNMATEATMKELLEAIGGGQTTASKKNSLAGLKNPFISLASKAKSLENAIKGTFRPLTGFVTMLGKGEVRMSAFGTHLNDTLIKKLPVVGGLFGGVTSVAIAGVSALETWNTESKKLAPAGATFGNSLLEFAQISAMTRMSLDELNSVVGSNIEKFSALGPNINQGVRNFSTFSNEFFRPGNVLNEKLYNMGYNFKDINENMVDFLFYTQRTSDMSIETNGIVQTSFFEYMRNLDALTKIFGKNSAQVNDASAKILKDSIFQIALNKKDKAVGVKTAMGAQALTLVFGESVAEIFKSQMYSLNVFSGASMDLNLMLGNNLRPLVKKLTDAAQDPETDAKEMRELTLDVMAEGLLLTQGSVNQKQRLLEIMSVAPEAHGNMYGNFRDAAATVLQKDLKGKDKAAVRKMLAEALEQQEKTETITEIINAMKQAATYFKGEFQTVLIKELNGFGTALSQYDLPELFRKAGEWSARWTVEAWQRIQEFFKMVSTESGRDYFKGAFANEMSYYSARFTAMIKNAIAMTVQTMVPESVNTTVSGMADRVRDKFGVDIPLIRTSKDMAIEDLQDSFVRGVGQGRLSRLYTLANMETPYAKEGGPIMPGTVIYPDYASMGTEDLGPLVWKDNKWQSKQAVDMIENIQDMYKSPSAYAGYGGYGFVGIHLMQQEAEGKNEDVAKFTSGMTGKRMDLLGQRTGLNGKGFVFSSTLNKMVDVNAKYADKFQSLIDLLEGVFGLKLTSLSGETPSLARLQIETERYGSKWFKNLTEVQQQILIQGMADQGLLGSGEGFFGREAKTSQTLAAANLEINGELSALYKDGGVHKDETKFRNGTLESTLESTGRLFNDFGRKKKLTVSGDKAILTKPQFDTIKEGAAQIPMKDLVNSVNSSVQEMIRLERLGIIHNKTMLGVA